MKQQHHDLLRHYTALMNDTKAFRIKELWLGMDFGLGEIYPTIIKEFNDLVVHLPGFTKSKSIVYYTEGSSLILTAMLYLNEGDKASIWNKYKRSFAERDYESNMTLEEYHAALHLNQVSLLS
jgi:hypothetical protein